MRRVSVVGSTGTGKTTFGRELARIMAVPFVELDALNWGPNWTMLGAERFQTLTAQAIAGETWVVDGNYGGQGVRELVWAKADTIIWLDYSLAVILPRLWKRSTARISSQEEIWPNTGNRETFRETFMSRNSLFWWAVKTYGTRRRNYPRLLALPQYASATRLRLAAPRDAERWLDAQRAAGLARIHT